MIKELAQDQQMTKLGFKHASVKLQNPASIPKPSSLCTILGLGAGKTVPQTAGPQAVLKEALQLSYRLACSMPVCTGCAQPSRARG